MDAWHFTGPALRDGRPIPPIGETLRHEGPLIMCESGLHASRRLIDALHYSPGATLHRVKIGAWERATMGDKIVARERTILWTVPAKVMKPLLRDFARRCALDVIHLWDAPPVVIGYLRTGDEALGVEVLGMAREAYAAAAKAIASSSSWNATKTTALAAASAAAWDAARDDARAAARNASCASSWDEARGAAARDAAKATARDIQNRRLASMVMHAKRREERSE